MLVSRRLFNWLAAAALGAGALVVALPASAQERITVFAAASLKDALDAVAAAWKHQTGGTVTISYAASSALARQIEQGAPADLFISADVPWMDYLRERNLIRPQTETLLIGNRLVLVTPADSDARVELAVGVDLLGLLGADGRLALANVAAVPAGRYARQALESLGAWPGVQDRVVQAENVRAALALVAAGEAPLGIVYHTDATADPSVRIVATFPQNSHSPIQYPAAILASSTSTNAARFMDYLNGPAARQAFEAEGFTSVGEAGASR